MMAIIYHSDRALAWWEPDEEGKIDPKYTDEPSISVKDALKLVPLFYTVDWTDEKKAEWLRITGTTEATTKVMCDHICRIIAQLDEDEQDAEQHR